MSDIEWWIEFEQDKKEYTVHDVIAAEYTLEPLVCLFCDGSEVTFDQYIGDAYCADCGKWQLGEGDEDI